MGLALASVARPNRLTGMSEGFMLMDIEEIGKELLFLCVGLHGDIY